MTDLSVSDEVRDAAAVAICPDVQGAGYEYPAIDGARGAIDHLVDGLGWGPRPSVDANVVCEDIDCCGRNTVIIRLRECGIEVTDGE